MHDYRREGERRRERGGERETERRSFGSSDLIEENVWVCFSVGQYEPGEMEVFPMMLGMDGTVTKEWLDAFASLFSMLKIMIRCVTNPEDLSLIHI